MHSIIEMNPRCVWAKEQIEIDYHDNEWGVPLHNDRKLFEFLVLEGMQAGLSWRIILNKRQEFRKAFDNFQVEQIANYDIVKINELCSNPFIIRNKKKIEATISNANEFVKIQKEFGSFDTYIWNFVRYKPIQNSWKNYKDVPSTSQESDLICKDLKNRGFRFVGSKICYSMMQAIGMVNDHTISCFRYKELRRK
ncbi:MAG TPA: DNA-3-methyladenine glycosylase I [Nitrososphaeraceae archaeon]|nr:DNA-3-methyladenine glycosylase I [Nitrososphaeraceae archaeon]